MSDNTSSQLSKTLPFSEDRQRAFLAYCFNDRMLMLQSVQRILPTYFSHPSDAKVWSSMLKYYRTRVQFWTSKEEFLDFALSDMISLGADNKERTSFEKRLALCLSGTGIFSLGPMLPELTEWLRAMEYKKYMSESIDLYNKERVSDALSVVRSGIRAIDQIRFVEEEEESFDNWATWTDRSAGEMEGACTFGHPKIDELINPLATSGALLRGDTTLVLAPSNVGKTTVLISAIAANLLNRKDVLWISHEDRPDRLKTKLICCMANMTEDEFRHAAADPHKRAGIDGWMTRYIRRHLVYVPLNKAGYNVEELDVFIRRRVQERIVETGKSFDLLVDDYPAKLYTEKGSKGHMQIRHIQEIVYGYFVAWALEHKWHSLVAIQGNRTASKINRRQSSENRLLTPEDVSEAWGPITTATNIFTINRDNESMQNNLMTLALGKSRSSVTGMAIVCKGDWAKSISHGKGLPVTWYQGTSTMSGKLQKFIESHEGRCIERQFIVHE